MNIINLEHINKIYGEKVMLLLEYRREIKSGLSESTGQENRLY